MKPATLRTIIYLSAGIGLVLSVFAAIEIFNSSAQAICSFNPFISCSKVDNSGRTTTLGIADWIWGVAGFAGTLVLVAVGERTENRRVDWALLLWITIGVALSIYLAYVELAVIGALCIVCFGTYIVNFAAWLAAIGLVRRRPESFAEDSPDPSYLDPDESVVL